MNRLFIALFPPRDIATDLSRFQNEDSRPISALRWKPAHNLHLTLKFIGDTPADREESIRSALSTLSVKAFHLTLGGLGVFPPKGPPHTLWMGLEKAHPHLFQLHKKIEDSLLQIAIPADLRAYHPHLSLARCQGASEDSIQQYLKRHRDAPGATWKVDRFFLMHSLPKPNGHSYLPIEEYPLLES